MWLLLGVVGVLAGLLVIGVVYDRRDRRQGRRVRDGAGLTREFRENRRDLEVWERGSLGNSGEDISWMSHRRRGRQGSGGRSQAD